MRTLLITGLVLGGCLGMTAAASAQSRGRHVTGAFPRQQQSTFVPWARRNAVTPGRPQVVTHVRPQVVRPVTSQPLSTPRFRAPAAINTNTTNNTPNNGSGVATQPFLPGNVFTGGGLRALQGTTGNQAYPGLFGNYSFPNAAVASAYLNNPSSPISYANQYALAQWYSPLNQFALWGNPWLNPYASMQYNPWYNSWSNPWVNPYAGGFGNPLATPFAAFGGLNVNPFQAAFPGGPFGLR